MPSVAEDRWDLQRSTLCRQRLRKFARSFCQNFPKLQAEGHPKWREVQMALPELPRGWLYYPPMQRELKACIAEMQSRPPSRPCTQEAKILGLCKGQ